MMGKIIDNAGGSLSLADFPKAIIGHLQATIQPDYSYDYNWVSACLRMNVLSTDCLAGQAMAAGLSPYHHCKSGGGLV